MSKNQSESTETIAAFVGIDWGDQRHVVCVLDHQRAESEPGQTGQLKTEPLDHEPEAIAAWAETMRRRFDGQTVAVALEQSRGGLVHALMQYDHLRLYPINPKQAARYREALSVSGKKSDPFDARMLARMLREHHDHLRPWTPDDVLTRRLARLGEVRRKMVENRKKLGQQLTDVLKLYFPQVLDLVGELYAPATLELLRRWPSLRQLQRAHPKTLRTFFRGQGRRNDEKIDANIQAIRDFLPLTRDVAIIEPNAMYVQVMIQQIQSLNEAIERFEAQIAELFPQHESAELFRSLPGAGAALAPRLLVAMGDDRQRFESAEEVQCYSGIAPVTRQSGKSRHVNRRYACPKFIRQTFHEFADHARKWNGWSKAYYQQLRAQGKRHHAAVRALAFKWIRIIFRMWKTKTPYDDARYVESLKKRHSPLVKFLESC